MRMRLQLDDIQQAHHAMGQMAEQAKILHDELLRAGFSRWIANKMMLIWWQALINSAFMPKLDLNGLLGEMMKKEEEGDG